MVNNWGLSGLLALSSNTDPNITAEGVTIMAHQNPEGIAKRIGIFVRKITPLADTKRHPKFDEIRDSYELWCHYILESLDENLWINSESLIQQMEAEVIRILRLTFDPFTITGSFFTTNSQWENRDDFTQAQYQLNRVLNFSVSKLQSRDNTVPVGYGGVIVFDITNSDGNNLPGVNYAYTEAYNVEVDEGWDTVEEVITGNTTGQGVPVHFTAKFAGFFQCELYPKLSGDIGTTGTHRLNQIYRPLTVNSNSSIINELPRVFFIQTNQDTEGTPKILSDAFVVKPTRLFRAYNQEQLVKWRLQGKLYQPSVMTTS